MDRSRLTFVAICYLHTWPRWCPIFFVPGKWYRWLTIGSRNALDMAFIQEHLLVADVSSLPTSSVPLWTPLLWCCLPWIQRSYRNTYLWLTCHQCLHQAFIQEHLLVVDMPSVPTSSVPLWTPLLWCCLPYIRRSYRNTCMWLTWHQWPPQALPIWGPKQIGAFSPLLTHMDHVTDTDGELGEGGFGMKGGWGAR